MKVAGGMILLLSIARKCGKDSVSCRATALANGIRSVLC